MPRVALASFDNAPVIASPEGAVGEVETRALFARDVHPLHLHAHRLAAGAAMRFHGAPSDCLVYVWEGNVEAGGVRLNPRSSAIVEYGASLTVTAGSEGAVLLAFGSKERDSEGRAGGSVHLLPQEQVPRVDGAYGNAVDVALHADTSCPTCNLWLHETDYLQPDVETPVHYHTADEIIFVRAGNIRLGRQIHGPGTAIAIAADTKYGFFSGPDGLSFINFRVGPSKHILADESETLDEVALWHSVTGPPQYLETSSS